MGMLEKTILDSSFLCITTTEWHGILWENLDGHLLPFGHEHNKRLRRQEMKALVRETGAAYLSRLEDLESEIMRKNRLVLPYNTGWVESLEIDSYDDLDFCRQIASSLNL
jgi:CMP-N-acetylneuraminic acid synthetase